MSRRALALLFCCLVVAGQAAEAAALEGGTGILYGSDYAFSATAPRGWMLDNAAGVSQGLNMVFYPAGSSWESGAAVIYGNASNVTASGKTPRDLAESDIRDFRANNSPHYSGRQVEEIGLPEGRKAQIWWFEGDKWGNREAIAYVAEKKTINLLVLTARNQEAFDRAWPSFRQLVLSYRFVADHIVVEKKAAAPPVVAPEKKP